MPVSLCFCVCVCMHALVKLNECLHREVLLKGHYTPQNHHCVLLLRAVHNLCHTYPLSDTSSFTCFVLRGASNHAVSCIVFSQKPLPPWTHKCTDLVHFTLPHFTLPPPPCCTIYYYFCKLFDLYFYSMCTEKKMLSISFYYAQYNDNKRHVFINSFIHSFTWWSWEECFRNRLHCHRSACPVVTSSPSTAFSFPQVERCYYFLQACVETAQRKEPVDGRLVQFLLSNPTNDGGQWDMLVNLIG